MSLVITMKKVADNPNTGDAKQNFHNLFAIYSSLWRGMTIL